MKTNSNLADINSTLSAIILNVDRLNWILKFKERLGEWITKHNLPICYMYLGFKDTNGLKVKGLKKIHHANSNQNESRVSILISNKIDLKTKIIIRQRRTFYYF